MATVYLARDLRHHREVAVKVLRPELAASLGSSRFLREIEIAAKLAHPAILPLLDSGDDGGFLYYVMPFVEGQTLRDRLLREGELPVASALRILTDVVDALAEAHRHGVIQRDIKPENVLLTRRRDRAPSPPRAWPWAPRRTWRRSRPRRSRTSITAWISTPWV
jgi:serine/threonine-protein kinase